MANERIPDLVEKKEFCETTWYRGSLDSVDSEHQKWVIRLRC